MAGVMSFSLVANTAGFVPEMEKADASVKKISASTTSFKDVSKLTTTSTRALTNALSIIGFQVAPALTSNILAGAGSLKALNTAMTITGAGIPAIGLVVAGVAASFFTWSKGIEAVNASLNETKTNDALKAQTDELSQKIIPLLMKANTLGRLNDVDSVGLRNQIVTASGDEKNDLVRKGQRLLRGLDAEDQKQFAGNELKDILGQLKIGLLEGPDQAKAQFIFEQNKTLVEVLKKAQAAGADEQPIIELFNKLKDAAFNEIDSKAQTNGTGTDGGPRGKSVSNLERIGFTFGGGGNDPARQTMDNTRKTAETLSKHTAILNQIAGNRGGNLVNA